MKKKEKSYQDKLMEQAKGTLKLGTVTTVGSGVIGTIGGMVPGSEGSVSTINAALNLSNIGNLANIGMNILPDEKKKKKLKW